VSDKATISGFTITRTVRIEAPLATVWKTITEAELIGTWFSDAATFDGSTVGSTGLFTWEGHGEFAVVITALEPETVFEYRWAGAPSPVVKDDDSTLVRFTLEADGDATVVTVVESGFDTIAGGTAHRRKRLDENREGWNVELDELAGVLED
jgi:uncharacterized protein YndB with AHSA1/START domain